MPRSEKLSPSSQAREQSVDNPAPEGSFEQPYPTSSENPIDTLGPEHTSLDTNVQTDPDGAEQTEHSPETPATIAEQEIKSEDREQLGRVGELKVAVLTKANEVAHRWHGRLVKALNLATQPKLAIRKYAYERAKKAENAANTRKNKAKTEWNNLQQKADETTNSLLKDYRQRKANRAKNKYDAKDNKAKKRTEKREKKATSLSNYETKRQTRLDNVKTRYESRNEAIDTARGNYIKNRQEALGRKEVRKARREARIKNLVDKIYTQPREQWESLRGEKAGVAESLIIMASNYSPAELFRRIKETHEQNKKMSLEKIPKEKLREVGRILINNDIARRNFARENGFNAPTGINRKQTLENIQSYQIGFQLMREQAEREQERLRSEMEELQNSMIELRKTANDKSASSYDRNYAFQQLGHQQAQYDELQSKLANVNIEHSGAISSGLADQSKRLRQEQALHESLRDQYLQEAQQNENKD